MTLYFASVLPGLEYVLSEEMLSKIRDVQIVQIQRGKVFFTSDEPFASLGLLRSADNLFQPLDRFRIGPHKRHLSYLKKRLSSLDLDVLPKTKSFRVNASRKGKHTYSRFEAADAAMEGIQEKYPEWKRGTAHDHHIEFRLDLDHDDALFSLRLTDAGFRYRNTQKVFARAALSPPVAHAMVWLSEPSETDIFVDPCCGSGTLLSERSAYPATVITGGDISGTMVMAARENLEGSGIKVKEWDARCLPIDSGHVDKVVTNLPFGRQIVPDGDILSFYHDVMKEIERVLKPGGKAVILSEHGEQMTAEAGRMGWTRQKCFSLSLKGLHPVLQVFQKPLRGK